MLMIPINQYLFMFLPLKVKGAVVPFVARDVQDMIKQLLRENGDI